MGQKVKSRIFINNRRDKEMGRKILIFFVMVILVFTLCNCDQNKNEHFELENTSWGMTMEETMEAYQVERDDLKDIDEGTYGSDFMIADGREIFGAKTDHITFAFLDMTVSGKTQKLHKIYVMYPDDTDMSKVIKNMKQDFGKTTDKVTTFDMISTLLDSDMRRYDYEADEHLTLWADKKVSDVIPKEQSEEYEKLWEIPMTRLTADKWEEFSENASLVYVYAADNAYGVPVIGKKGLCIDTTNWVIYNTIKEELE